MARTGFPVFQPETPRSPARTRDWGLSVSQVRRKLTAVQHAWARCLALQCKADEAWRRSSSSSSSNRREEAAAHGRSSNKANRGSTVCQPDLRCAGARTRVEPGRQRTQQARGRRSLCPKLPNQKKVATERFLPCRRPTQNAPASPTLFFFGPFFGVCVAAASRGWQPFATFRNCWNSEQPTA
jgi:hypothetical protein